MNIDLKFTVTVLDTRGKDAISDSGSMVKMEIIFKTKTFRVAELKLSEVRGLIGASEAFRAIEANAVAVYTGESIIPSVTTSISQEKFIAWAKTFGNSQSLAILNAM